MAIIFLDGFEDEGSHDRWGWTTDPTLVTGPQSRGRAGQFGASQSDQSVTLAGYDSGVGNGYRVSFRVKVTDFAGSGNLQEWLQIVWDSNQYIHFRADYNGSLQIFSNAATPDSVSLTTGLTENAWHFIEFAWDRTSSSVTRIVVSMDGVVLHDGNFDTYTSVSGVDDAVDFWPRIDGIRFTTVEYDDFMFENTFSATPRGNVHVDRLLPNGAGNLTDWGGAYTDVDDDDPTTSTGTSISSTTATDQTSYEMENFPVTADSVLAVMYEAWCQGTANLEPLWRSSGGSVGVETTDVIGVPASYGLADVILEQNPQTATGWTVGDVNTGQFGVELA